MKTKHAETAPSPMMKVIEKEEARKVAAEAAAELRKEAAEPNSCKLSDEVPSHP